MSIISPRSLMLGVLSWLVPFAISFLFVDHNGQFIIPRPLFKSTMVVVAGGIGCYLLLRAFRHVRPTARSGLLIGCVWMVINLALDMFILVPIAKMTATGYLSDIGLQYLLMPIIGAALGAAVDQHRKDPTKV